MTDRSNRSVDRAFTIVDELAESGSVRVSELADRLEMPVSTTYDYLQALTATGYVIKEGNHYRTTTRFLEVGYRQLHREEVFKQVDEELDTIAEETGEHVTLMIEEDGMGVLVAIREGEQAVDLFAYPGARMPLHATAPGKALLAYMPDERVDEILDQRGLPALTNQTITDQSVLRDQLEDIRERGYAVDEGERIVGMVLVAAPILDKRNRVQAAICVGGPQSRFGETRRTEIADVVQRAANVTQVRLDYKFR